MYAFLQLQLVKPKDLCELFQAGNMIRFIWINDGRFWVIVLMHSGHLSIEIIA